MTSGDDLRPIAATTCPPASRRLHSSSAVEKVDGGVTVWGITVGSNCQIALPVFGTLFLAVGIVLTGIPKHRTLFVDILYTTGTSVLRAFVRLNAENRVHF